MLVTQARYVAPDISGVSNSRVNITEKLVRQHTQNTTFELFTAASLDRLVSYPLVLIYLRFEEEYSKLLYHVLIADLNGSELTRHFLLTSSPCRGTFEWSRSEINSASTCLKL